MEVAGEEYRLLESFGGVPFSSESTRTGEIAWFFGWLPRNGVIEAYEKGRNIGSFYTIAPALAGTGAGRTVLLYDAVRKVWGEDLDPGPQAISDCVGWAFAGCVDLLACVQVMDRTHERHSHALRTSTEALYAMSRRDYGDGGSGGGSYGAWGALTVEAGGTLSRRRVKQAYPDRPEYDPNRAHDWAKSGVPEPLKAEAREHRVRTTALIRTFEEARDAIANGYPVAASSRQGFSSARDRDGFARPVGIWDHSMKFIASRDDWRPGLLCMNSFGTHLPTRNSPKGDYDIPNGSFWVDSEVCTSMFAWEDSYALSMFDGYTQLDPFEVRIDRLHSLIAR